MDVTVDFPKITLKYTRPNGFDGTYTCSEESIIAGSYACKDDGGSTALLRMGVDYRDQFKTFVHWSTFRPEGQYSKLRF